MDDPVNSPPGYEAIREGCAYFPQPDAGFLIVKGEDRAAFLQRQTTNDVKLLNENQAVFSVLTTPTARILDVLYLLAIDERIEVVTLPGSAVKTASFLKSRIFFNDRVEIKDVSSAYSQIDLIGLRAGDTLAGLGGSGQLQPGRIEGITLDSQTVRVLHMHPSFRPAFRLLVPVESLEAAESALQNAGAELLSYEGDLTWRIEAGLPDAGYELTDDYTPLEAGLQAAVADNKGCYTGQEVIARQITYDKVTKRLCGLRLDGIPSSTDQQVWVGKQLAGELTSTVVSPRFGSIGLAVLKRPHDALDTEVIAGGMAGEGTPGRVVQLPFGTPSAE